MTVDRNHASFALPLTASELEIAERLALETLDAEDQRLQADQDHYMWGKKRNELNHYMDPARVIRMARQIQKNR